MELKEKKHRRTTTIRWPRAAGVVLLTALAGCGDDKASTPLDRAQQARSAAEDALGEAGESLENIQDSMETAQQQLDELRVNTASLQKRVHALEEEKRSLQEHLAAEKQARQAAEQALAEARQALQPPTGEQNGAAPDAAPAATKADQELPASEPPKESVPTLR